MAERADMTNVRMAIAFLFLASTTVTAQEVTLTSKAKEIYLGAQGAEFYKDSPVVQGDLFATWKSGIYADLWWSTAANSRLDFDKEIDLVLGYARKVGRFGVSTDVQYYFIQGIDVANVNVEAGLNGAFVRLEAYTPVQPGGPGKGLLPSAGYRGGVKLASRLGLDAQGWLKGDTGAFGFDPAILAQGYFGFKVDVAGKTTLLAGMRLSAPISTVHDGRKKEARWEIGFSQGF